MVKSSKTSKRKKDNDDSQSEKEIEESEEEFMNKAQGRTRRGAGDAKTNVEMMILARGTKLSTPLPDILDNELISQRMNKIIVPWREFDVLMSELNGLKIANNWSVYDPCRPEFDVVTVGRTGEDTPVVSDDDEVASDDEIQQEDDDDEEEEEEEKKKKKKVKKKRKKKIIKKKNNKDGTSDVEATTGDEDENDEDEDENEDENDEDQTDNGMYEGENENENKKSSEEIEDEADKSNTEKGSVPPEQSLQPPTQLSTSVKEIKDQDGHDESSNVSVTRILSKKEKRAIKARAKAIARAQAAARRAKKKDDARKRMAVRKEYLEDELRIRQAIEGDVMAADPDYEEGGKGHIVLYIEGSETFVLSDKTEASLIMMLKEGRDSDSYTCGPSNSASTPATDVNWTMSDKKRNVYKVSKAHMMCKGVHYLRNTPRLHRMWRRFVRLHIEPQLNIGGKNTESNWMKKAEELFRDWYREQIVALKEEEEERLMDVRALSSSDDSDDDARVRKNRNKNKNKNKKDNNNNNISNNSKSAKPSSSEKKQRERTSSHDKKAK